MTYEFPFEQVHPDVVIWQVGRGMKGALSNLHGVREIKVSTSFH